MASTIPTLSSGQVTRLARLLDQPTGSELRRDLQELRLPVGTESTKWRMLRESFELAQRRDGHGGSVLRFVQHSFDPARELEDATVQELRSTVNEVLLLSGLELRADGQLVSGEKSSTADDARARADQLRVKLSERRVHHDVLRFCNAELVQRNYFHAVLEAAKSISAKIRDRTGLKGDGIDLVNEAFSLKEGMPPLAFNALQSKSERSAHSGYANFARGIVGAFRNPTAHEPKVEFDMSEADALDMLTTISLVHRRLDEAAITPAAPVFNSG
ncbi:MAG: TIGR02391 family protein [Solirubrobacterales bacterium]